MPVMAQKKQTTEKKPAPAARSARQSEAKKRAEREQAEKQELLRKARRRRMHAVVPPVLCAVAIYTIACYIVHFSSDETTGLVGFVGSTVIPFSFGLFGVGALAIPLYLFNIAIFYKSSLENGGVRSKATASLLNLVFIAMLLHLVTGSELKTDLSGDSLRALYYAGADLRGGGILGGVLCGLLKAGTGYVGTLIITGVLTFVSLVFVFGMTPGELAERLSDYAKAKRSERRERMLVEEYERELEEKKLAAGRSDAERAGTVAPERARRKSGFVLPTLPQSNPQDAPPWDETAPDVQETAADDAPVAEPTPDEPIATITELASSGSHIPQAEKQDAQQVDASQQVETQQEPVGDDAVVDAKSEKVDSEGGQDGVQPYVFPPVTLLSPGETFSGETPAQIAAVSAKLVRVLESFKVKTTVINVCTGPAVTRYELQPAEGVKTKSIANLAEDIALHLAARSIRIESPIPGKSAVGIELPNEKVSIVRLRDLIETKQFRDSRSSTLTCLGMDVTGNPVFLDISKMPHLLIAGATGMGKSVCINSIIISLLYKSPPSEVRLILIDPKKVELNIYNGIPHLLVPVVTDPKKAAGSLNWAVVEMERRFSQIQDVGAHDITEYNELTRDDPEKEHMPIIVIFIDELADLMMSAPDDVETSICRLCQKARAAGIHLVIGTQRPSVDVITGLIKSNIPSRIAFTVASQVDSRTIIDIAGAEKLMGRGDMLYSPVGMLKPLRVQGAFVETREVTAVCEYVKRSAEAGYSEDIMASIEREARMCGEKSSKRSGASGGVAGGGDELLSDEMVLPALQVAVDEQTISTSLLQRKLKLGYSRAAKIIDILESNGYVGKFDPAIKGRKILITSDGLAELRAKLDGEDQGED